MAALTPRYYRYAVSDIYDYLVTRDIRPSILRNCVLFTAPGPRADTGHHKNIGYSLGQGNPAQPSGPGAAGLRSRLIFKKSATKCILFGTCIVTHDVYGGSETTHTRVVLPPTPSPPCSHNGGWRRLSVRP